MQERKIEVRDKNNNLLAIFSNMTPASSNNDKKSLMISPTIDIVSNGESTLSFQMFADSQKWKDIKNPENLYYCNNRVYTALNEQSFIYNGNVVNVTLVELWYLLRRKFVQVHNVDTTKEAIDTHTVKILPKTDSSLKLTVNGVKYEDSVVKDSRGVLMPRGSAGYALWGILKGTDWRLGVCDVLPNGFNASQDYGSFNVESDMKDVLSNIELVQELYGGILVWDSLNKVLHLRDERKEGTDFNTWKGYTLRKEKNLSEYPTVTWDNNIITRVYPLGNGNLNIKKVNNDKPYVENFSYTNKVYEAYIENSNIYDTNDEGGQKTLKFWAEQQLLDYCKPRKTISYTVVDSRAVDKFSHETFDINDIAQCYYNDGNNGNDVVEYLRIQHLNYNYFFPSSESVIEVGDKISNEVELFHQIYKQVESSVSTDSNGHVSGDNVYVEIPEDFWEEFEIQYGYGGSGFGSLTNLIDLEVQHSTENTEAIAALRIYADDTFATIVEFTEFREWTEDGFKESSTKIEQVSTALYAQIELEAKHHQESLDFTTNSVASLKLYVEGEFAQATLTVAYSYTDEKVSDAVSEIKVYASQNYATIQMTTELETAITNANDEIETLSTSLTSFKQEVSDNYAKITSLANYVTNNGLNDAKAEIEAYAAENFASIKISASVTAIDERTKNIDTSAGHIYLSNRYCFVGTYGTGCFVRMSDAVTTIAGDTLVLSGGSIKFRNREMYISGNYIKVR